ncbi:hypothetical protein [Nocardia albiluteola]|uniref:hypothetical protein n=1 Tax=Nocardia albiluteola TaxID=2842303 RepID=UPI001FD8C354|nr:hypothetical protein [Nocardia albiluteola]
MPEQPWYHTGETTDFGAAIHETAVYEGPGGGADFEDDADPGGADPAEHTAPETDGTPQDSGFTAYSIGEATLRNGEIVVKATESGLLLDLHVDSGQLRRDLDDLAEDLLRLCQLAANRAGLARRAELTRLGLTERALDLLGLPTQDAVEQTELGAENNYEYEPRSWLDHEGSM